MQAWSRLPPLARAGIVFLGIALFGLATWGYNRAALAAFDDAVRGQPRQWLEPARTLISFLDRLQLPWLSRDGIAQLVGPKAIDKLAEDPLTITTRADAVAGVLVFNQIRTGCTVVLVRHRPVACSAAQTSNRLRRIDTNLEGSRAGRNHYVAPAGQWLELKDKISFSSAVCNLYPSQASVDLSIRYDPSDRLGDQIESRQLAAGECATLFSRKLRHAPTISGSARAAPYYDRSSGQTQIAWSASLEIANGAPAAVWGLNDPSLCHTSPTAVCSGQQVGNPLAYARALAASLENADRFARLGPGEHFKFTVGLGFAASADRTQFGVIVDSVVPGSPAEAAGLYAGDRIVAVGDTLTFTNADVILAIDRHGAVHGRNLPVVIEVLRGGELLHASVTLGYNRAYWDSRGYGWLWATYRGVIGAGTLGTVGYFYCMRTVFNVTNPDGRAETYSECLSRWALESDVAATLYGTAYNWGQLAGSFVNPLRRMFPPGILAPRAIANATARRFIHSVAVNVLEDGVTALATAPPNERMSDLMGRLQASVPQTILTELAGSAIAAAPGGNEGH